MISNRHDRVVARRASLTTFGLLLAVFASGCATTPAPEPPISYPDYLVGAPDKLMVTVLPEPTVQEAVVVRPDGKITIQLIGDVQAAGRTPHEIAAEIEERIGRYKRGARATVAVTQAVSSAITVLGEVRRPGTFPISKETRVAEAVGTAGGLTSFANDDNVHIVRGGGRSAVVIPVDLDAIQSGDMATNVQLRGGDIIYVPPTVLARIGYTMQALLFPFQPLLGVAYSLAGNIITPP